MKNNNNEIWSKIEGYPNYEVSSTGKVMNMKTGRILRPAENNCGYLFVYLSNDNVAKKFYLHRLVAEAFLLNTENLKTVDHVNGIKTDNNVYNLQWLTLEDNVRKARNKRVSQYYKNGEFVAVYVSVTEASRQTGVDYRNISKCCNGKLLTAGGYIWRYENI